MRGLSDPLYRGTLEGVFKFTSVEPDTAAGRTAVDLHAGPPASTATVEVSADIQGIVRFAPVPFTQSLPTPPERHGSR